jgi:hypothetical protein
MQRSVRATRAWLDGVDPGAQLRLKGLRLVAAYAIAAALGGLWDIANHTSSGVRVASLAGGFALWGSVAEAREVRLAAYRDLVVLCAAATVGAVIYSLLSPVLRAHSWLGGECILVTGAFLVAYLKCFGVLGGGIGSQVYIGQLLAFGLNAGRADLGSVVVAGGIAMLAAVLPRSLIHYGQAAHATSACHASDPIVPPPARRVAFHNGMQAATAALAVVALNNLFVLTESAWAITACVYVITATTDGTLDRARRRIVGTLIGVPIGLACMPIAAHAPLVTWILAGLSMIIYTVSLPRRYDIACGAFAFTLIVTLEVSGQHSDVVLLSRIWETMLGATLGVAMALLWRAAAWIRPKRPNRPTGEHRERFAQVPSGDAPGEDFVH